MDRIQLQEEALTSMRDSLDVLEAQVRQVNRLQRFKKDADIANKLVTDYIVQLRIEGIPWAIINEALGNEVTISALVKRYAPAVRARKARHKVKLELAEARIKAEEDARGG